MPETNRHWPLAFVHLMKTGGQTMRAILRKNFGASHCDMLLMEDAIPRDWRWVKICYPGLKSVRGHCIVPHDDQFRSEFPRARFYTILRDPIKRAISHYRFRAASGDALPPFEQWLEENGNYMTRRIAGEANAQKAIDTIEESIGFVGLVERFDESLLLWSHWAGLSRPDLNYRIVNQARPAPSGHSPESSDESRELLEKWHGEDSILYRYATDVVFPRQLERFGKSLPEELDAFEEGQKQDPSNGNFRSRLARLKTNGLYRLGVRKVKGHEKAPA